MHKGLRKPGSLATCNRYQFKDGTYRFKIRVDDGVRLWVDNALVIDSWHDGSSHLIQKKRHISEGRHRIKVEYYEHKGGALIDVKWKKL
jgi:hypothetical protein